MVENVSTIASIGKEMLSESKFYMGYSRWNDEKGRYETWSEAVDRVMEMHKSKYADKLSPELLELIDYAADAYKDKLILGAQRALQFGGEQLLRHQAKAYNCLKKDTKFITSVGVRSFADFKDGDVVTVLTHKGNWKRAVVRSYGKQQLFKYTFKKGASEPFDVYATKDHRWILTNNVETTSLDIGDILEVPPSFTLGFDFDALSAEEKLYWCYGFVYGDGTLVKGKSGEYVSSMVRLCGDKRKYLSRFEEIGFSSTSSKSLSGDYMVFTGRYLKTLPNPEVDSPELIRAFTYGYLDADGAKNRTGGSSRYVGIQTSDVENLGLIKDLLAISGVYVTSEVELTGQETNYGVRGETLNLRTYDSSKKCGAVWKVAGIEKANVETVWCLEVEDDHSFVLPNGIVTGNCSTSYADRAAFFNEAFYLLLCGCGVGFSVQPHHTNKLPGIAKRSEERVLEFVVPDSIEGWADSVAVMLSSYFVENSVFPEFKGHKVLFDFSKIRPRGAMISGGFKAPGPDGLRNALVKIESLIERELAKGSERLRPIDVYDIVMHIADAVLSGGVRRSATICLFDKNDQEMMKAKTGDWFVTNPQRGRSNNSALLIRDDLTREEWADIMRSVKDFGEPGFVFAESTEWAYNPCVTGDALLICKDHGVTKNGEMLMEGVEYEIPLEKYVELYGDDNNYRPMVLSYDEKTGKKVWGKVTAAALTRKNAEVIELEIDEGTTLRVTPDHKVYTENRGWVEAKDLTTEDILIM